MSTVSQRAAEVSEARGYLRGLGFAYHMKGTGGLPHENVDIRFDVDGRSSASGSVFQTNGLSGFRGTPI
jgi:hypothetical protein